MPAMRQEFPAAGSSYPGPCLPAGAPTGAFALRPHPTYRSLPELWPCLPCAASGACVLHAADPERTRSMQRRLLPVRRPRHLPATTRGYRLQVGRPGKSKNARTCQRAADPSGPQWHLWLGREPVTCTTHGFHHDARPSQRLTQALDVYIHCALFNEHMVTPDLVQQLGPAVNTFRMLHEKMQQLELGGPHLQWLPLV